MLCLIALSSKAQERDFKNSKAAYILCHLYFPVDVVGYFHPTSMPAVSQAFYTGTGLEYRHGGKTDARNVFKFHLGTFTSTFTHDPRNSTEVTGGHLGVITAMVGYGQRRKFSTFSAFAHVLVGGASVSYPTVEPVGVGNYRVNYITKYGFAGALNVGMAYAIAKPFDVFAAADFGMIDNRGTFLRAGMPYFTFKMGIAAILFSP
jgi:hypothetical protein